MPSQAHLTQPNLELHISKDDGSNMASSSSSLHFTFLFFQFYPPTSPLIVGYTTRDEYKVVSKSKSLEATFPHSFRSSCIPKAKIHVLFGWSYRFPWITSTIESRMANIFWPRSRPIFCKHIISFWNLFLEPRQPNHIPTIWGGC